MRSEKDLMKQVTNKLDLYQFTGEVAWWGRLNSLKVKTVMGTWVQGCPKGTPDLLVLINGIGGEFGTIPLFIECKSDSGTLRKEQLEFINKYKDHKYIFVLTVTDVRQLEEFINHYAVDTTKEMKEWNLNNEQK